MSTVNFVQRRLTEVRNFPCVSSTYAAINLPKLLSALEGIKANGQAAQANEMPFTFSAELAAKAIGMSIITYVALKAFHTVSCVVNGTVGVGKIALSLLVSVKDYKAAQNLLEEGVFHTLIAVADFAIAYFPLVTSAIAILNGIAPLQTNRAFENIYKPWNGAIEHQPNATEDQIHLVRKNYSILQGIADAVQCLIMPDDGVSRFKAAYAALQGKTA